MEPTVTDHTVVDTDDDDDVSAERTSDLEHSLVCSTSSIKNDADSDTESHHHAVDDDLIADTSAEDNNVDTLSSSSSLTDRLMSWMIHRKGKVV